MAEFGDNTTVDALTIGQVRESEYATVKGQTSFTIDFEVPGGSGGTYAYRIDIRVDSAAGGTWTLNMDSPNITDTHDYQQRNGDSLNTTTGAGYVPILSHSRKGFYSAIIGFGEDNYGLSTLFDVTLEDVVSNVNAELLNAAGVFDSAQTPQTMEFSGSDPALQFDVHVHRLDFDI